MTRADELDALAERVEKLMGQDREIDALIACAVFKTIMTDDDLIYCDPVRKYEECAPGTYWLVQRSGRSLQTALKLTESLDAAMSLVPEGHLWRCGYSRHVPHNAEVVDYASHKGTFIGESDHSRACALIAACLRAQASIIREAGR